MSHASEDYCRSCRPLHNRVDALPVKQRDYPTEWTSLSSSSAPAVSWSELADIF